MSSSSLGYDTDDRQVAQFWGARETDGAPFLPQLADVGGVVAENCESTAYDRARYYNSLTGRFLSRDPEAGKPTDPKTLHKYLYAGGDPVNAKDPNGHTDLVETALNFAAFGVRQIVPIAVMACQLENLYQVEYMLLNWYIGGPFTWGDPRIPGPVAGACALAGLPWVPGPEPPPPPEPPFPWPPPGTPVN